MAAKAPAPRGSLREPKNAQRLVEMFRRNPDISKIATHYGTSPSTVRMILRANVPTEFDAFLAQRRELPIDVRLKRPNQSKAAQRTKELRDAATARLRASAATPVEAPPATKRRSATKKTISTQIST